MTRYYDTFIISFAGHQIVDYNGIFGWWIRSRPGKYFSNIHCYEEVQN